MDSSKEFKKQRGGENQGLVEKVTFELVSLADIKIEKRVFELCFIDTITAVDIGIMYKSRLTDKNYDDEEAANVVK